MIENEIRIGTQSITLDGDHKITWSNAWSFYHVKNIGETDALVSTVKSLEALVAPTEEIPSDVMVISAGASLTVPGRHSAVLLTSGNVQVIANNNPNCPFNSAQVGSATDPGRYYVLDGYVYPNGWMCETSGSCYVRDDWMEMFEGGSAILTGSIPKNKEKLTFLINGDSWAFGPLIVSFSHPELGSYDIPIEIGSAITGVRAAIVSIMIPSVLIGQKEASITLSGASGIYIFRAYLE